MGGAEESMKSIRDRANLKLEKKQKEEEEEEVSRNFENDQVMNEREAGGRKRWRCKDTGTDSTKSSDRVTTPSSAQ